MLALALVLGWVEEQISWSREKLEAESSSDSDFDWELGCNADGDGASVAGEEDTQSSTVCVCAGMFATGKASASNSMVTFVGSNGCGEDRDAMLLFKKTRTINVALNYGLIG